MNTCDRDHMPIWFEGPYCHLCSYRDILRAEIRELKDKIEELEEERKVGS